MHPPPSVRAAAAAVLSTLVAVAVPAQAKTAPRPSGLIGSWHVEAPSASAGMVLHLEPGRFDVGARCGHVGGPWKAATGGPFLATADRGDGTCYPDGRLAAPSWLRDAAAFRFRGSARELLDADGRVLVTLRRTGAGRPTLSSVERAELDAGLPRLAPGLRSATRRDLLGVWRPVIPAGTYYAGSGHVRFRGNGSWSGSDGCGTERSRWRYAAGRLLALPPAAGGETACLRPGPPEGVRLAPPQPVASWVVTAVAAAFDRDILVLLDREGDPLGRLERSAN